MLCVMENFWLTPLLKSNRMPSNSSGFSETARGRGGGGGGGWGLRGGARRCERERV